MILLTKGKLLLLIALCIAFLYINSLKYFNIKLKPPLGNKPGAAFNNLPGFILKLVTDAQYKSEASVIVLGYPF